MENHNFQWENPLFMAIFNSYFDITRGYPLVISPFYTKSPSYADIGQIAYSDLSVSSPGCPGALPGPGGNLPKKTLQACGKPNQKPSLIGAGEYHLHGDIGG